MALGTTKLPFQQSQESLSAQAPDEGTEVACSRRELKAQDASSLEGKSSCSPDEESHPANERGSETSPQVSPTRALRLTSTPNLL